MHAVATGNLPDPCTRIDEVSQSRQGNVFTVRLTTARPADVACIQVIASFEEVIPLEVRGLPAGDYTVDVNGVRASFTLQVDN